MSRQGRSCTPTSQQEAGSCLVGTEAGLPHLLGSRRLVRSHSPQFPHRPCQRGSLRREQGGRWPCKSGPTGRAGRRPPRKRPACHCRSRGRRPRAAGRPHTTCRGGSGHPSGRRGGLGQTRLRDSSSRPRSLRLEPRAHCLGSTCQLRRLEGRLLLLGSTIRLGTAARGSSRSQQGTSTHLGRPLPPSPSLPAGSRCPGRTVGRQSGLLGPGKCRARRVRGSSLQPLGNSGPLGREPLRRLHLRPEVGRSCRRCTRGSSLGPRWASRCLRDTESAPRRPLGRRSQANRPQCPHRRHGRSHSRILLGTRQRRGRSWRSSYTGSRTGRQSTTQPHRGPCQHRTCLLRTQ